MSALKKKGGVKSASLLAVMLTALLALVSVGGATAAFATGGGAGGQVCSGLDSGKIDTTGDPQTVTVTAPAGMLIDGYCVKAGSSDQGDGPVYVDVDPPVKTLTISYPGGKAVSHYSLSYVEATPADTEIPIPATSTKVVCGPENDVVVGTPGDHYSVKVSDWVKNSDGTSTKTVTYTADEGYVFANGETEYSDSYTDENTECPPPPATTISNPTVTLTGVCGVGNDTVAVSHSEDYTSSEPVWNGSKVSVTFTIKDGVNKVFENGEKSITITKDEVNTEDCNQPPTEISIPGTSYKEVCGTENDQVTPGTGEHFSSTVSDWVKNSDGTSTKTVTYTADEGYVFANGETEYSETYVDHNTECPPPADTEIPVPTVPVIDECGTGNAHYGDVPSGNYTVVRNEDGSITLTAKDGYVFPDGQKSVTLPAPEEKNTEECSTTDTEIPIPATSTKVVCGPENDVVVGTPGDHYSVKVSDWVKNSDGTSTKTVTYTADEGYVFANGETEYSDSYTDESTECPPPPVKTLDDVTITPACGYVSVTNPKSNPTVTVYYGSFDEMEPDGTMDVKPGKTVKIKTTRTSLDGMVWADGYEPLVFENVKVKQNCTATPPPHTTPPPPHHNPPVVHPHPVTHHNPAPWTPPTKQRTSGGNTGVDTVVASQASAPSLGLPIGLGLATLIGLAGIGLLVMRRRTPAPAYEGRHIGPKKA